MGVVVDIEPSKSKLALEAIYSLPLKIIDVNPEILTLANDIIAKYRINGYDATHIATSMIEKADIFITNDRQLKRVEPIRIILPTQYAMFKGR